MQMLDVKNRCWSDEVLEALGVQKDMLGKVYEHQEVTGRLRSQWLRSGLTADVR